MNTHGNKIQLYIYIIYTSFRQDTTAGYLAIPKEAIDMKLKSGNSHSITQVCDCDLQELDILPNCVPANDRSSSLHLSARASPCQRAKAISGYFSHLISAVTFSPEATKRPEHHTNWNVLAVEHNSPKLLQVVLLGVHLGPHRDQETKRFQPCYYQWPLQSEPKLLVWTDDHGCARATPPNTAFMHAGQASTLKVSGSPRLIGRWTPPTCRTDQIRKDAGQLGRNPLAQT